MAEPINQNINNLVTQLLVSEKGLSKDSISIDSYSRVDWPTSALGCPQKGMNYLQVVTPGFKVDAVSNGVHYFIHTSLNNAVICEQKTKERSPKDVKETMHVKVKAIQMSRLELLKNDLVDKKHIRLMSVIEQLKQQLPSNCSKSLDIDVGDKGYLVVLQHHKSQIAFYSDGRKAVECWRKSL